MVDTTDTKVRIKIYKPTTTGRSLLVDCLHSLRYGGIYNILRIDLTNEGMLHSYKSRVSEEIISAGISIEVEIIPYDSET